MSWLQDMSLRDLDEAALIEARCLACRHTWILTPTQLLLRVDHRDVRLDEVAANLACPRRGCRGVGARLMLLPGGETSGFVGGMP